MPKLNPKTNVLAMALLHSIVLALFIFYPALPTQAADPGATVTLQFENDVLGVDDSDQHYTNGLNLSWQSAPNRLPQWLANWSRRSMFFNPEATLHLEVGAVGALPLNA